MVYYEFYEEQDLQKENKQLGKISSGVFILPHLPASLLPTHEIHERRKKKKAV